ncbi:MAG TPA: diadenylate cyclase CdaA [Anaerolineae bacterium]|nr:diadenylate cyclase CdaA [Anaerolineae bacterium]
MNYFQGLYTDVMLRLSHFSWMSGLDLLLVTLAFYLLLSVMQNSRATLLLRGVLILGVKLSIVMLLLPLPAVDWLVQETFAALFITLPVIFQPELRRLLEHLGRLMNLPRSHPQATAEQMLQRLVRAIERMAASHTGAIIALEGHEVLRDIAKTGIAIDGQITSELLEAIFFPKSPLHDGAVILRDNRVTAAGCVLPLTQQALRGQRRLGTRHRAATGLSESSDALVIVVSEETGQITLAYKGQLHGPLDSTILRQHLCDFWGATPPPANSPVPSLPQLLNQLAEKWQQFAPQPDRPWLLDNARLLLVSLILALAIWLIVPVQAGFNPETSAGYVSPQSETVSGDTEQVVLSAELPKR